MMDSSFEILDAFVDGETVDPVALKQALSHAAGRDYFVDAWLIRRLVQDEMASDAAPPSPHTRAPMRSWLIAATIAGVCLVGGYMAGARFTGVLVPRPGTPAAPAETTSAPAAQSFPVPPATRVIRLELDPNWKETGGR
jgi:hypothetical protein